MSLTIKVIIVAIVKMTISMTYLGVLARSCS